MEFLKEGTVEPSSPPAEVLTTFQEFLRVHEPQLTNSGVPSVFWSSLHQKLQNDVWDLSQRVKLNRVIDVDPDAGEDLDGTPSFPRCYLHAGPLHNDDPESIFLIDHVWTFELPSARTMLRSFPNLLGRMCDIMDIDTEPEEGSKDDKETVEKVCVEMWKFVNTYSVNSAGLDVEQKMPRWYMMDEIGSRIRHSDQPNCRVVPFYYIHGQITYSLLFPLDPTIAIGEELTRNYVEHTFLNDTATRICRLLPFVDMEPPAASYEPSAAPPEYFRNSKLLDSLPTSVSSCVEDMPQKPFVNVFAEYDVLEKFLTDPRYKIVDNQADADILWYNRHFNDFRGLSAEFPEKFVNQFPYESVVTVKDLLALVCRRAVPEGRPLIDSETLDSLPVWLPTTYNLDTDLPNFLQYFLARRDAGRDNLWICKPWNLARSLDMTITGSLNCILRLPETGPKLCSKYIENPVLFRRDDVLEGPVKFDLRFIALLKSVSPLRIAIYKRFWLRFANKAFALDDFDVYDKHFTVMNYGEAPIHQMFCEDFIKLFEKQYPGQSWAAIEKRLYDVVAEVFKAATSRPPPEGIAPSPQSRAVYGLDFMLAWKNKPNGDPLIQPMLLEINYSPDCKRACDYYPDFYNQIFNFLFLDQPQDTIAEL